MAPPVSDSAIEGLKFSECLPPDLAMRVVQTRLSDVVGTAATLGRRTRLVSNG
jgi:ATP-dependent Lhr-like helicase